MTDYRSPLLARPGAVAGDGVDTGVAGHYGQPYDEQRRLLSGEAVVDLSHRGVLKISGPDRLSWLHSLTTQSLSGLAPFVSRETLILGPTGHIEHALHVVDDGEKTWVTTEPASGEAVAAWLDSMRFMLRVEVADVSESYAVIGEPVRGEGGAGSPVTWTDPWPELVGDTTAYGPVGAEHPGSERAWREVIVPRAELADAVGDRPLAGLLAAEALRVHDWRPRAGFDTDHRSIVHELDWLRTAVHLHKGCYRGQETVARVHNLGRPPRRIVHLHLDGSDHVVPERGSSVFVAGAGDGGGGGRPVGYLATVARHYEDGPIALAVIKRSTPVDAELDIEGIRAAQTVIVAP